MAQESKEKPKSILFWFLQISKLSQTEHCKNPKKLPSQQIKHRLRHRQTL
jgi:hypothetical protein